jgi:hypothetical protein
MNAEEFRKAVQQTVEHIANHPPFQGPSLKSVTAFGISVGGDPYYAFRQYFDAPGAPQIISPICPHCGKRRFCGR